MVGGKLICSTLRQVEPHRDVHDTWKRGHVHCLMQQKLNTKSSTEAELVAVDDAMGKTCGPGIF